MKLLRTDFLKKGEKTDHVLLTHGLSVLLKTGLKNGCPWANILKIKREGN